MNPVAARMSPATVAQACDPDYMAPPHLRLLSRTIMREVSRGSARIIVTMPPRHGKSEMCSRWTPVWFLEQWPKKRVLLASYGSNFAKEWGRKVRNTFRENEEFFNTTITDDSKAADQWNTPEGGGMATCGVGGPMTGRGAHLLVIDDPVKDSQEARSATIRKSTWQWWLETARTRIDPGGSIIVIMTRWNADDIVGRLNELDPKREVWTRIDFPAVAEESDDLGRNPGEPLWPEWYDSVALDEIKRDVGSYAWSALYQQRPTPEGGAVFQRECFRYYVEEPDLYVLKLPDGKTKRVMKSLCWIGQVADTAMKVGEDNNYTVVMTYTVTQDREIIILDVARVKLEVPKQWPFVQGLRIRWRNKAGYRFLGIEDKASGVGLIQTARMEGDPVRELKAIADKVTRATPAAIHVENGMAYFPEMAHWLPDFEGELLMFPNGVHDDQVDTFAYAVRSIRDAGPSILTAGSGRPVPKRRHDMTRTASSLPKPIGWR